MTVNAQLSELIALMREQTTLVRHVLAQSQQTDNSVRRAYPRIVEIQATAASILAAIGPDTGETVTGVSDITIRPIPPAEPASHTEDIAMSGSTPSQNIGTITNAQEISFELTGNVPAGDTFVEPTLVEIFATSPAGTVTQGASSTAPTDGSAPVSPIPAGYSGGFTTPVTYSNTGFTGTTTLECEVQGVDNFNVEINVGATLLETIGGVSNVVIGPIGEAAAVVKAVKAAKAAKGTGGVKAGTLVQGSSAAKV